MYDAKNRTNATAEQCEALIGQRATLTLTGEFVKVGADGGVGPYVYFQVDDRWGFTQPTLVGMPRKPLCLAMDVEAFTIEGEEHGARDH